MKVMAMFVRACVCARFAFLLCRESEIRTRFQNEDRLFWPLLMCLFMQDIA
jgi:hypothetical protein